MTIFEAAPITPYGAQRLDAGSYWFVDTSLAKYETGLPDMAESLKNLRFLGGLWDSSRDWAMAEFGLAPGAPPEVLVPQSWGVWYRLPPEMTLEEAKVKLYGDRFSEPAGFFEWLEMKMPGTLQTGIKTGEVIKDTASAVAVSGFVTAAGWILAILSAKAFLSMFQKRK